MKIFLGSDNPSLLDTRRTLDKQVNQNDLSQQDKQKQMYWEAIYSSGEIPSGDYWR